ncbi:response regulator transcription factor [Candidatus Poribacteria bacterium]|nr:response regulator transcription factor [Candidatus Poribacteria bacterium]
MILILLSVYAISSVSIKAYIQKADESKPILIGIIGLGFGAIIASGLTNKEISNKLFISIKTIETHRTRIMEKLNLHNTASLVKYAIETENL